MSFSKPPHRLTALAVAEEAERLHWHCSRTNSMYANDRLPFVCTGQRSNNSDSSATALRALRLRVGLVDDLLDSSLDNQFELTSRSLLTSPYFRAFIAPSTALAILPKLPHIRR